MAQPRLQLLLAKYLSDTQTTCFRSAQGTSSLVIDINAFGTRDPAICASCNSIYTDNYTVNLFSQTGTPPDSHGVDAGPMGVAVPAGATTLEIVSQLSIAGLLGPDGLPLSFGNLNISSDGSIMAATPIPSTLPLLATGLAALGLLGWHRRRKAGAGVAAISAH